MLLERLGINAVSNPGAIYFGGKYTLVARVEGNDRKSFFTVAESESPIDGFRFRDYPIVMPETDTPDTNVYDMRLVQHEDGWIYGLFCAERQDPKASPGDLSAAIAQCGIARTRDLTAWERLPDLVTRSQQQRNVVLHPEFVGGRYAFHTRPQDGFINAGSGSGIGFGLADDMGRAAGLRVTTGGCLSTTLRTILAAMSPAQQSTNWLITVSKRLLIRSVPVLVWSNAWH